MHDKDTRKTAVELRIQQAVLDDHDDPDIQRLRNNHICFALLSLVNQFYALERQCRNFGTDVEIYLAEIQMIMTIHNAEGIHVNGLAQKLGITKGSVSEMLRKLERKGLVRKEKDPLKMTRLNVYLTAKGTIAHQSHIFFHQKLDNLVLETAAEHDPETVKIFAQFLNNILGRLTAFSKADTQPFAPCAEQQSKLDA
ncbi:MAG: MarR family winged helix-turn-helix transcriptional regulator [Desulfovibrio sp.]|uniref:MarR family winged helix-turn-helix transcriptional regulator n=1 Tax=Desulfovibrio sp. TaxID=885 RepID=UPI0039E33DC1